MIFAFVGCSIFYPPPKKAMDVQNTNISVLGKNNGLSVPKIASMDISIDTNTFAATRHIKQPNNVNYTRKPTTVAVAAETSTQNIRMVVLDEVVVKPPKKIKVLRIKEGDKVINQKVLR